MSSQNTVYLNLREITELHKPDIQVKDVAEVYCSDAHVQNRCASLKIKTIREQKRKRYVENALNVIRIMEAADSSVTVSNVGKVEFITSLRCGRTCSGSGARLSLSASSAFVGRPLPL